MIYTYIAKNPNGETIEGEIEAANEKAVLDLLSEQGLTPLSLNEKKSDIFSRGLRIGTGIRVKDLVVFSRQLSVMISAGLPLVKILQIMVKQTTNRYLKSVTADLAESVRGGSRFSSALAKYPKVFDNFFVNIIRAGETSGKLDETLNYLANEQEKNYDLMSKIKSAMVYPIFILAAMSVVVTLMMIFVVPKLTAVMVEAGVELPIATKIVIGISNFSVHYWWLVILIIIGAIIGGRVAINQEAGRWYWDRLKLKVPIFGGLFQRIYLVRLTRSLSTLMTGGVPLVSALKIVKDVVGNMVYKKLIDQTVKVVEEGHSMAGSFMESPDVPVMLSQMIMVGEQTGQLDEILEKMANFFSREVENLLDRLVSLFEPLIIVVLGVGVGVMVAAIIMPMYKMASAI